MKKSIPVILAIGCISALIFVGCKKKEVVEVDNETQSAVDNAVADQEFAGIVPTTNNHSINTKGTGAKQEKSSVVAPCDTLTKISGDTTALTAIGAINYSAYPVYTLSVNGGCALSMTDNKIRSGSIKIRLFKKVKQSINNGKPNMVIYMQNYKTGLINYTCDSIVVTTSSSSSVAPVYTEFHVVLINGACVSPNWNIKYSSDRYIRHYPKGKSATDTDPVTEVWGTANGVNRTGRAFSISIPSTSPIIKRKSCQYIDQGVLELAPDGFKTRIVDFGNGTCDDNATFTVNGNTVAFKLK